MKIFKKALLLLLALFASCGFFSGPKITDEVVANYIKAYTRLKEKGPEFVQRYAQGTGAPSDMGPGIEGYTEIEKIIKESGFKSYKEFVEVNAKIGLAYSQIEGRQFMNEMDKMHSIGNEEIDKQLADPQVPEEVKAQLRETRQKMNDNLDKNKPWAEGVMKGAEILGDKETMEVVRRNAPALRNAYTGGIAAPEREFLGRKL
ncbi:MAG: hypothetical protein JNM27_19550 [Leptospirales bacterium]|nr:hypothetical protein [Leptospirales bacterium]